MSVPVPNIDVAPVLLESLVCPVTREELVFSKATSQLIGKKSKHTYAIKSGIPIMIPER